MERMKLKVIEVKMIRTIGDNKVPMLEFLATDTTGATHAFELWKRDYFNDIVKDKEIEVEFDTTTKQAGENTYTHRKIVQIFKYGQPIIKQGAGGFRGRSPEENRSIEVQVAAKLANDRVIAGKASVIMTAAIDEWIMSRLGVETIPVKIPQKAPDKPQDAQPAAKVNEVDKLYDPEWLKAQLAIKGIAQKAFEASLKSHGGKGATVMVMVKSLTEAGKEAVYKELTKEDK